MGIHQNLLLKFTFIISCCCMSAYSDVTSTTGNIKFDVNNDANFEAILDSTGLGIGTTNVSANLHVSGNAIITGDLNIGASTGNSTLHIDGSLGFISENTSTNTILSNNTLIFADTSSSNLILSLPAASSAKGRVYQIKKISASNNLIINGLIDNYASITLGNATTTLPYISLISSGNQWHILSMQNNTSTTSSDNLIGWWTIDTLEGTIIRDSSSNENHATLFNDVSIEAGKIGSCGNFQGTTDYLNISDPTDGSLDMGTQDFSMSAWVKMSTSSPADSTIFYKGAVSAASAGYRFMFNSGKARMNISDGSSINEVQASNDLRDDTWHHILTLVDRGGTSKMYVDNVLRASKALGISGSIDNGTSINIGAWGTVNGELIGLIDDVRIYNKLLSTDEIAELYNLGSP